MYCRQGGLPSIFVRCLIALAAVAGAVLVRLPFAPILGRHIPLVTFPLAVLVAGYFGGLAAGLLATALGMLAAHFLIIPPNVGTPWPRIEDAIGLGLFMVVGVSTSVICEALRRARRRAEHNAEALRASEEALRQAHEGLERRVEERTLELARANQSLQSEIHERMEAEDQVRRQAAALQEVNERLAEADRRKDEFLAMLAHELRNPLAPVRYAVQIMNAMCSPGCKGHQRMAQQRDIVERQVSHMARLIGDLLDVSRITRGRIEMRKQTLRLAEVFERAIEMISPVIESRRHTLHASAPPPSLLLEADPDRLTQAIGNLLANAAKFTPEGGRIWLEAGREGGEAIIRVRDNGSGIEPQLLPHIFDLFVQADRSLDRTQGGLGIGLTLVRKIAQMHGGTVEARSAGAGQGSEFTLRLPAIPDGAQREIVTSGLAASASAAAAPCRILVVDDLVDTAETLADVLRLAGHEVRTAYSGQAALSAMRDFRPDVVFLDIGMPDMDGYQVARSVRQEPAMAKVCIVALTGYGSEDDRRRAQEAGFDRHLTKPVDLERLQEVLTLGCKG